MDNKKEKYLIELVDFKEIRLLTVPEILEEINRDRSDDWVPYSEVDWRDGLEISAMSLLVEYPVNEISGLEVRNEK